MAILKLSICMVLLVLSHFTWAYDASSVVATYRVAGTEHDLKVRAEVLDVSTKVKWTSNLLAYARFDDVYNTTGWSQLSVHGNPDVTDMDTAYAAGYAEGYATAYRIEQNALNSGVRGYNMSTGMKNFFKVNREYLSSLYDLLPTLPVGHIDRKVIYHTRLTMRQLQGLYTGYTEGIAKVPTAQRVFPSNAILTFEELELLSLGGDLEDLEPLFEIEDRLAHARANGLSATEESTFKLQAYKEYRERIEAKRNSNRPEDVSPVFNSGRCSALIRRTPSNDLYTSHVTWSSFNSMLRIWKWYDLPYVEEPDGPSHLASDRALGDVKRVAGHGQSFASYPGALYSGDDFYVTSAKLTVLETTIGNDNMDLARDATSPLCILEWVRNVVANRLARTARDWHAFYARFNSGTYNNMNIVVDYNLLPTSRDKPLPPNTVVISEQVPGTIIVADVSSDINANDYFASYNIARDSYIRQISGTDDDQATYGEWFGFGTHPRAKIFARDAPHIQTMDDMKRMMRSCDFKNDEYSSQMETCQHVGIKDCYPVYTAENCIATRGDLNPKDGVWGMGAFALRNHVASDAKIVGAADVNMVGKAGGLASAWIVNGPPGINDNPESTPTFVFSKSAFNNLPHAGIPDRVEFAWQLVQPAPKRSI